MWNCITDGLTINYAHRNHVVFEDLFFPEVASANMHEETLLGRLKKSINDINSTIRTTRHKVCVLFSAVRVPFWSFNI